MLFLNRQDAALKLADKLVKYKDKDAVLLALPRGGVPIAAELSKKLHVPFDILAVRKVSAPYYLWLSNSKSFIQAQIEIIR